MNRIRDYLPCDQPTSELVHEMLTDHEDSHSTKRRFKMHEMIREGLEHCQSPAGHKSVDDLDNIAAKFADFALRTYKGKLLKKALAVSAALSEYNCELTWPERRQEPAEQVTYEAVGNHLIGRTE